jgi:hypothetical protein
VGARRLLPVDPATRELRALETGAIALAADLLADVVQHAATAGTLPAAHAQGMLTPLCRWMDADDRSRVEAMVRDGAAHRLFDRWRAHCRPPAPPWDLPQGLPPDGNAIV